MKKIALVLALFLLISILAIHAFTPPACQCGMIANRQIRDDPNHTRYAYIATDVSPVLEYGDVQF